MISLAQWLRHRQRPDPCDVTLQRNRIYILPSNEGLAFALMLLAGFLGAMNYQSNLALGGCFLLSSIAFISMIDSYRCLVGLRLKHQLPQPAFANQEASLRIELHNNRPQPRRELQLSNGHHKKCVTLAANSNITTTLRFLAPPKRGWMDLDSYRISCRFPLGLFTCWCWLSLRQQLLIYPAPAALGRPLPWQGAENSRGRVETMAEREHIRAYQRGDPPRQILWKVWARGQGLHCWQPPVMQGNVLQLDFKQLAPANTEQRLAQLCRWILEAEKGSQLYALTLPHKKLAANRGERHQALCLRALALFPS